MFTDLKTSNSSRLPGTSETFQGTKQIVMKENPKPLDTPGKFGSIVSGRPGFQTDLFYQQAVLL
jgi:hypothetical protein